jgi:Flp pilus assembly pilin Flp
MRRSSAGLGVFRRRDRGSVSVEYAFLAAAAVVGLIVGAAALADGSGGPVERALQRASAAAQAADSPGFSARGGGDDGR